MPPRPQPQVYFDPEIGKFRIDIGWPSSYSGHNRVSNRRRVQFTRAMYDATQAVRAQNAIRQLGRADVGPYGEIAKSLEGRTSEILGASQRYEPPATEDPDWNAARINADYLAFQLGGQAEAAKQIAERLPDPEEPSGWRGVVYDALNNPGGRVLTRGLDVVSRPAYAVAETFDRLVEDAKNDAGTFETLNNVRQGFWAGLSGREKTSIGDVLRENEVLGGKPSAVAGFAGDVAFDPLTYLTFGTSTFVRKGTREALGAAERSALEAAARTAADDLVSKGVVRGPLAGQRAYRQALSDELTRAGIVRRPTRQVIKDIDSSYGPTSIERTMRDRVTGALKDPFWQRATQRSIAAQARKVYTAERKVLGETVDVAARKKVGEDALAAARDQFTRKVGADVMSEMAARRALRENVQLDVKFAGRRIASSQAAGKALRRAGQAAKTTRAGSTLARTFRTDAEIGTALHRIQRQFYNVGAAQFEDEARAVKRVFQDLALSKRERQLVSRAIESGDTKGFTTQMNEGYEAAQRFFHQAFDREVEAGALSATDHVDNYLYHVYKNPHFSRGLGSWVKPVGRGSQKFRTLDEATAAGARPLTDIADILVHRLAKSHRVSASWNMMRTIAARFGIDLSGGKTAQKSLRKLEGQGLLVEGRKIGSGAGRFFDKGVYFDQDVASSLSKMEQIFSNDAMISQFGKLFDQMQSRLKFLQTAPNPGFHIRNTMSDMFVNFLDGVTSIRPYKQAMSLVTNSKGAKGLTIALRDGTKMSGDELIQLYDGMGLRAGFFHAEAGIIPGMGRSLLTGSSNVVRRFSEIREDVMRMAHFIDALKKSPPVGRTEEIAEIAAARVRKYNFDYQDLTSIERRVFRRAVPFYTFMRKNVPLMLESYLTRPGRMTVPSKGQNAVAAMLGNDNRDEPLPGMVNATPQWISAIPGIEITPQGAENDAVFAQPDMPYNQLEELFGGFSQGPEQGLKQLGSNLLLEQSTALVRGPAEYFSQTDLATGADQPQTPLDTIINQFPIGRLAQQPLSRVAPGLFFEGDRPDAPTYRVGGMDISETVANYLTGFGFRKVTPERMQSELRRRQDLIEGILRKLRERQLERINEQIGEGTPYE